MTALLSDTQALRTSGALVLVGAVLSGPVAMLVVAQVSPQPAWSGVSAFADNYHPVQALPYVLGYILGEPRWVVRREATPMTHSHRLWRTAPLAAERQWARQPRARRRNARCL